MAAYNRKALPFIYRHLWYTTYHDEGHYSHNAVMMHDLDNIGIAVRISLLSCIQVEIYVISQALPVIVHPL